MHVYAMFISNNASVASETRYHRYS